MKIFRLRQHYYALREIPDFARMKADVWVDDDLPSVSSRYVPTACSEMNVNGYWVMNPATSVHSNIIDEPLTMHPICPGSGAKDAGTGVFILSISLMLILFLTFSLSIS